MQQNQESNQNQNDVAETEDEGIGVGTSKQSKITIIVIITVFISAVVYFMFLKDPPEATDKETANEIIIDASGGAQPTRGTTVDYDTGIIDTTLPGGNMFETPKVDSNIPELPELPQLSDEIKQQIAAGAGKKEKTFTKDEVDALIDEKMKDFMEKQMEAIANLNQPQQQDGKKPSSGVQIFIPKQPNQGNNQGGGGNQGGNQGGGQGNYQGGGQGNYQGNNNSGNSNNENIDDLEIDDLYNSGGTQKKRPKRPQTNQNAIDDPNLGLTEEEILVQQQKQESDNLAKIQKNRALQERKAAPIFKMSGGNGPANSLPQDSDAIILSYTDAKLDIKSKAPDVLPTQVADLTRVILQGKVIAAVLETAIDTDLASTVRAVITRDVYAEEGKNILIPRGSRVIGSYATDVASGQTRVTINWNRIIRVDGMSLNITSIGADRLGRAGVQGELDNKYAQQLANSFLSSVLSVGTSIAVEKMSGSTGITSTISSLTGDTTQTSGKASDYALIDATQQFMDDAQQIVDDIAEQKPVIRIPQGEKVTIMVTQDVTLPVFKRGK